MTLSSTISARKTNIFLSLFISKKKVNTFSLFISFFIVNNRFFNIFIALFKSSKTIQNWVTFVAILTIFFAKIEIFENIFFLNCANSLLIQINSKERKAIKDDYSFLWKKKKRRRKTKELVVCWNQRKENRNVLTHQTSRNSRIQSQQQNFRKRTKKFRKSKKQSWLFFSFIWLFSSWID